MWPFLVFGGLFAGAATLARSGRPAALPWYALFLVTVLFVGLRHSVGMDWNNYLRMIDSVANADGFWRALNITEPFYAILLLIGDASGFGIYATNLIAAVIGLWGVWAFAKRTPNPWIALAAAMPMFIVVVSMSANRQALAAGLIMLLVANWSRFALPVRAALIVLCAGFHASAIIFLAFVAIDLNVPRAAKIVGIAAFSLLAIYLLQQSGYGEYYNQAYGEGQTEATQSSGALFHVAVNAIPAALYFLLPRYRGILFPTPLLRNMAFAALLTVPLVLVASAAAGRVSLYWFPVSMYVWAALPGVVSAQFRRPVGFFAGAAMVATLVFWLEFANSSAAHIPYENALFLDSWELEIGVLP